MAKTESLGKAAEKQTPQEHGKMPTAKDVKALAKGYDQLKADMDDARGELGALLKNAEDGQNIHRKAFKLANQLRNMPDDRCSAFLAHFDHYRQALKVDRAGLFDDESEDEAAPESAPA